VRPQNYVAALYCGWEGDNRRRIATGAKTVRFVKEVVAEATGEAGYDRFARHLYEMHRVGTVHLRSPKVVVAAGQARSSPALTWTLMQASRTSYALAISSYSLRHLEPVEVAKQIADFPTATMLPVSIRALFDDFLSACEFYAVRLEEQRAGGDDLIASWRTTADTLASPEPNEDLDW
jgi:hypothetical protein